MLADYGLTSGSCDTLVCPPEPHGLAASGSVSTTILASDLVAPAMLRASCIIGLSGDAVIGGGDREEEQLLELDSPSERE